MHARINDLGCTRNSDPNIITHMWCAKCLIMTVRATDKGKVKITVRWEKNAFCAARSLWFDAVCGWNRLSALCNSAPPCSGFGKRALGWESASVERCGIKITRWLSAFKCPDICGFLNSINENCGSYTLHCYGIIFLCVLDKFTSSAHNTNIKVLRNSF